MADARLTRVPPPAISVVMSVYNAARWAGEAVESVLAQTAPDFELIVVDDGSTDRTAEVLQGFTDPRINVIRQSRQGLTCSLNRALRLATAPLVARMDGDDVARPERFARQLAFLAARPEVGLLGTGCQEISASGQILRTVVPPLDDGAIRRRLIRENPFVHASVMMRRAVLHAVGGYDERVPVAQDYHLWMRMSRITRMANLPEPLLLRRLTLERVSSVRDTERLRTEVRVKLQALRNGAYPPWCALFLVKPLCALALPPALRRRLRRAAVLGDR